MYRLCKSSMPDMLVILKEFEVVDVGVQTGNLKILNVK